MTGPLNYKKRGGVYSYYCTFGGRRYRASLGVRDPKQAARLSNRIGYALADGPNSTEWAALKNDLPAATFSVLTASRNIQFSPELSEFQHKFEERLERRVKLGEITVGTRDLYLRPAIIFFERMAEQGVRIMDKITPTIVEEYLVWRKENILKRGRGGGGMATEYTTLQSIFNFGIEEGVFRVSPLKGKYKQDTDKADPIPFTKEEMEKLDAATTEADRLPYLILRYTGLRASDVCAVTWDSIVWGARTLIWKTKKRKKHVSVPLTGELWDYFVQRDDEANENLPWKEPILSGMTRVKLYNLISKLGERAGVENCHPHKFRTTLVCDLLSRGASLFDVSTLIGDTHAVVEKYYAAVTSGQQDRVRNILESSGQTAGGVVS